MYTYIDYAYAMMIYVQCFIVKYSLNYNLQILIIICVHLMQFEAISNKLCILTKLLKNA